MNDPELQAGWAEDVKWGGFRALLTVDGGQAVLRSRHGTDLAPAFPDITDPALRQLPDATALDGELFTWEADGAGADRVRAVAEPVAPPRRRHTTDDDPPRTPLDRPHVLRLPC
ncbi:hypothetical protein GPA10_37020 [Streptomyces sp. p1417]|uniref:ATP-dependent DNA ligase family profile domain-containing protein n=1 Tax=Streptomyces typhae TaxID=2681492 RepID=A0A6L6XA98_9ACTN|nr:hypothetical protein [Streptomyces typhae]MVO90209.1 hypothetical protein [Streptomyces typhae]